MAHSTWVDRDAGFILVRFRSKATTEEISAVYQKGGTDPELREVPRRLHDLREVDVDFSTSDLRSLAETVERARGTMDDADRHARKEAVVVTSDLGFGLARMLGVFIEDGERPEPGFAVFRSFRAAADWLGLPSDYRDPMEPNLTEDNSAREAPSPIAGVWTEY